MVKLLLPSSFASLPDIGKMSLNLTVPKETKGPASAVRERQKRHVSRRAKSPSVRPHPPRAKSKSPNPSFCSVLSRVKDWELGAFTPKTALADNVDVAGHSNAPFSDSGDNASQRSPPSEGFKNSPPGSPFIDIKAKNAATSAAIAAAVAAESAGGAKANVNGGDAVGAKNGGAAAVAAESASAAAVAAGSAGKVESKGAEKSQLLKSVLSSADVGECC